MRKFLRFCLVFVFGIGLFATENIGVVKKAIGDVSVLRDNQKSILVESDKIYEKDTIITGDKSYVSIIFEDKTQFRLGSNSNLSIKEYLFDKSKKSRMIFSSTEGSLDVQTGQISKIAKDNFKMHSNTLLIGIRGTTFNIDANNGAYGCRKGAITLTSQDGKQIYIKQEHMVFYQNSKFSDIVPFSSDKFGILQENWFNSGKFDQSRHKENKDKRKQELEKSKARQELRKSLENQ